MGKILKEFKGLAGLHTTAARCYFVGPMPPNIPGGGMPDFSDSMPDFPTSWEDLCDQLDAGFEFELPEPWGDILDCDDGVITTEGGDLDADDVFGSGSGSGGGSGGWQPPPGPGSGGGSGGGTDDGGDDGEGAEGGGLGWLLAAGLALKFFG